MKTNQLFRRALSLLLSLCMLLGLGVTAFAAPESATRMIASDFESNKTLTNGGDTNAESYTIDIDAIVNGGTSASTVGVPVDVAIVFDRSDSMSFPANTSQVKTFTSKSAMNTYLNSLNKDLWEGYYRVTNLSSTGGKYYSTRPTPAESYISWEALRYNKTTTQWETFITDASAQLGEDTPHGVQPATTYGYAGYYGYWVSMDEAFDEFTARKGTYGSTVNNSNVKFSIAIPRLTKAQEALISFVNALDESASKLPSGQTHTVSVISYGGTLFEEGFQAEAGGAIFGGHAKEEYSNVCTSKSINLAGSRATTAQKTAKTDFINVIKNQFLWSVTRTDWGMEALTKSTDYLPAAATGRNRIAVLLTDGCPTDGIDFQNWIANNALAAAKTLKSANVSVFALSFMEGVTADASFDIAKSAFTEYTTEEEKAMKFLQLVSSNYPSVTSITSTSATKKANDYFMADKGNGNELMGHMTSILEKIVTSYETPLTGAKDSVSIYDEITREFKIDAAKPIKVYIQKYNGNGSFAAKEYIGEHMVTATSDATASKANVYKLYWDCEISKADPNQPGVDLDISSVRLNWLDAKNAALRETAYTISGSPYASYTKGYKIGLEIPILVNRDNTLGGNNINTNTAASGLYRSTTDDSGNQPVSSNKIISYPIPNANVKAEFTTEVYDYFMDLSDWVDNEGASVSSAYAKAIFAAMLEDPTALLRYLENNKNDYVNLEIDLDNASAKELYGLIAKAKADGFTATAAESGASFEFTIDQILSALATLTYTSSQTDSIGVAPYGTSTQSLVPNYYGPKYVVVDFDETVKTPLDKEGSLSPKMQSGATNGKIEGSNICYNFRANYASGNKSFLESKEDIVKYQVTAINAPKGQSSNTVNRNFYVIPANVMTYDDTLLKFDSNGWETIGTATDSTQTYDNALRHGYDSIYNGTYSATYYHNAQKGVTVSKTKGTAQATFTIKGTGFDIFSQTSPDSGMMVVEVSTDEAYSNDIRYYIVDTYLADQTLYQIPVVRCDDLTYGTYYIRITAFYDSIFDHNYISQWKNGVITEEKLRERYGIGDDVDFTFIPSASGYDQPATRLPSASNGQYNVYVDGIRVYNTIDNVTSNKIAYYGYKQAGEAHANITNINDTLVDATNATAWKQGQVNGILYMAAGKTTAEQGNTSNGIILGMDGALCTKKDGSRFYVYKDIALTQPVQYNGNPVYYRQTSVTTPNDRVFTGFNFYYDGGSASKPMTRDQVVEAFGGMPTFYNSKYSQYGPEKEVYLSGSNGVAFKVGTGASKVMVSLKSHNGAKATVKIYNGSSFETLAATTSRVEMYYDITKYVDANGYIFIANGGGISAICNVKVIGTATMGITIDAGLAAEAARVFKLAGLPVDDSAEIKHTLDLQSDISLNYAVETSKLADYDEAYMEVEFDGASYILLPEIRGAYGYFTLEGLTAVDLTTELRATLHMFLGEEEFVSETDVYSVADYAYAQLNKAEASAELKAICANLLRYGAEAQSYKGYNTEAMADAAMTEEQKSYLTDLDTVVLENKAQTLADLAGEDLWAGKTLVLDSKITVKAIFNLNSYKGELADLKLRVSYTDYSGEAVELVLDGIEVYNAEAGLYSFDLDTLEAADMRTILNIALYAGEQQVSQTLLYSVESYCANKTGALGKLCKALMAYSDAAKAYFAN